MFTINKINCILYSTKYDTSIVQLNTSILDHNKIQVCVIDFILNTIYTK